MQHARHHYRPTHYRNYFHVAVLVFLAVTTVMCWRPLTATAEQIGVMAKVSMPGPVTAATTVQRTPATVADLIAATADELYVFSWDEGQNRYREQVSFRQFPAAISAVAALPATEGETVFLWVGMQGSGSVQLYALEDNRLTLLTSVGRLWSDVQQLIILDADGDGISDVVARSSAGVTALFRFDGRVYTEVWRTAANEAPDTFVAVGHVIDFELPTIVIGKDDGQFSLYRWEPDPTAAQATGTLRRYYDNFPWGRLQALHTWAEKAPSPAAGGDDVHDGNDYADDVYVISTQGWVYQYTWSQDESRLVKQWPHTLAEDIAYLQLLVAADAAYPGWLGIQSDGLRAFNLDEAALNESWHVPGTFAWVKSTPPGLLVAAALEGANGGAATAQKKAASAHSLFVVGPVADDFVRVERRGRSVSLTAKPLVEDGHVFLSLPDMTSLLGLRAWTAHAGARVFGLAPLFQFYVVDIGGDTATVNGKTKQLAGAPRLVDGVVYLPASFAGALGVPYEWDQLTRTLAFE